MRNRITPTASLGLRKIQTLVPADKEGIDVGYSQADCLSVGVDGIQRNFEPMRK